MERKCIICLGTKPEEKFNAEHIFPSALGGAITVHNVCQGCNSDMGRVIDQPFLSHEMILYYRNLFNLSRPKFKGQRNIPNPFKNAIIQSKEHKYKVSFKNNKPHTEVIEKLELEEDKETGQTIAKLTIAGDKIDNIEAIIKKLAKRKGVEITDFKAAKKEIFPNESLSVTLEIKNDKFIFGCMKIAYEAVSYFFPHYIEDKIAGKIRSVLKEGQLEQSYGDLLNKSHSALMDRYSVVFQKIKGLSVTHHAIFIENVKDVGLVCCVRIFNWFYPVIMSQTIDIIPEGGCMFVYNDAIGRQFGTNLQHIHENIKLSLDLLGASKSMVRKIKQQGELAFKKDDGSLPIYDHTDEVRYLDPEKMCIEVMLNLAKMTSWNDSQFSIDLEPNCYWVKGESGERVPLLGFSVDRKVLLQQLY